MDEAPHGGGELRLAFDTDEPEFVRGFELGRVWAILCDQERPVQVLLRATNVEHAIRLGEALGRSTRADLLDDVWLDVTFSDRSGDFSNVFAA